MESSKGFARHIAELQHSSPRDFDPEEDVAQAQSDEDSESEGNENDLAGTEHYGDIGKSKPRKAGGAAIGHQYAGSRISREALLDDADEDNWDSNVDDSEEVELEGNPPRFADPDDIDVSMPEDDADIDSDAAFGESDAEKFKGFTFRGSSKSASVNGTKKRPAAADFMSDSGDEDGAVKEKEAEDEETEEDTLGIREHFREGSESDSEASDISMNGAENSLDSEDESDPDQAESESDPKDDLADNARRAELRRLMSEDQKTVVAAISQAARADTEKGQAVKQQREAFASLVNVRMVLQKGLVVTNSLSAVEEKEEDENGDQAYLAAEAAAIKLWNTLDGIRHQLYNANGTAEAGGKRKRDVDALTSSAAIWEMMQDFEVRATENRQSNLEKWSAKVRGTAAMPISRKINPSAGQKSITSVLQDHLADSERLISRTKIPRSCAPIQRDLKISEDSRIYDDANFYQLILKELVDQKRTDALANPALMAGSANLLQMEAFKEAKTRKNVDTKASKGRKLRYTVHEKLQNFMAPEDRGSWEQDAVDRFFGSLLGQKMNLREDDGDDDDDSEDNGVQLEEESLKLFRS